MQRPATWPLPARRPWPAGQSAIIESPANFVGAPPVRFQDRELASEVRVDDPRKRLGACRTLSTEAIRERGESGNVRDEDSGVEVAAHRRETLGCGAAGIHQRRGHEAAEKGARIAHVWQ